MSDTFNDVAQVSPESTPVDSASHAEPIKVSNPLDQTTLPPQEATAQAIAELDKMDKFKLDGQEWTLKDLKAAILRQKDYTQKTQTLAEERKSFQEERKFHENLAWDLQKVRENPDLAREFVKIYPQAFHKHVDQFLNQNTQTQVAQQAQQQVQRPQVDVQTLSRLERLEKFYNDQEVKRAESEIEKTVSELSVKYPDAANFKETVLSRAYEARMAGSELTPENWETIFKAVDTETKELLKAKYGNLVKQQTEANAKARDVGAGGGTAGRAPVKVKTFDELAKLAESASRGG